MLELLFFLAGCVVTLAWCVHRRCKGESIKDALKRVNPLNAGGGGGGPIEPP